VRSQTGRPRAEVIAAFKAHFRGRYDTVDGALRPAEIARAEELVTTKFGTEEWLARVP
jgi:lipoate---protein ligase